MEWHVSSDPLPDRDGHFSIDENLEDTVLANRMPAVAQDFGARPRCSTTPVMMPYARWRPLSPAVFHGPPRARFVFESLQCFGKGGRFLRRALIGMAGLAPLAPGTRSRGELLSLQQVARLVAQRPRSLEVTAKICRPERLATGAEA